jgi:Flp pilus assembly protein TadD
VQAGAGRREEALELLGALARRSRLASTARLWRHELRTRSPEALARGIAESLRVLAAPDPVPEAGPELEAAFPGNPEVLYRKFLASRSEGDADPPVERELGRILDLDPDHHPARMALAGRHLARGDAGSAREVVEAGLARDADDPQLLALLGQVREVEGRGERAAAAYRAVFEGPLSRVPGPALVTAVHGLMRLGSGEEVAALLADLIEARPGDPLPHQLLAEREAANGDRDAAERRLREAQKTCGPLPSLVYALGDLLRRGGRTVEAEGLFQVLVRRHPESAWGHRGLGDLVVETSPAAALEHYETARRLDPAVTLPGFDYLLGVAALRAGDVPRARGALRRAVAVEPDNARYWCDLGACSFHAGDLEGAVAATERALRLRPGHPGFLHNLAVYLQARFRRDPLRQAGAGFRAWRLRRRVARAESKGWTRDLWTPGAREAPPRDE